MRNQFTNSNDFDLNYPKEEKKLYGSRRIFSNSNLSTDLSDSLDQMCIDTQKENARVVKFIRFLKQGNFGNSSDIERLREENERLKQKLKNQGFQKRGVDEFQLKDLQEELKLKNDEIKNKDFEIETLKSQMNKRVTLENEDDIDLLKKKLEEYRKKYFNEKKKKNEIQRNNIKLSNELQTLENEKKVSRRNSYGTQGQMKDDDYANLKSELLYEYDLLTHLKTEMTGMIDELEGNQEFDDQEEIVDNNFFDEND